MRRQRLAGIVGFGLLAAALTVTAGPLNPPGGSVAPTYKTLIEVEPRIAISTTNTPPGTNSTFKIRRHGSYYLTEDINGEIGEHGIEIASGGVTLDLNGFELLGTPGMGNFDGITTLTPGLVNITILNGSIRGWGDDGIDLLDGGSNARIERVSSASNSGSGIRAGDKSSVSRCLVSANGSTGIVVGADSSISDCTSTLGGGFIIGVGSSITRCTATGSTSHGIAASTNATILDCTSTSNALNGILAGVGATIERCSASSNADHGISCGTGSTVRDSRARSNQNDGILASASCLVERNHCTDNGGGLGGGAGIHVTGNDNRIDGNNCINSGPGLAVDGIENLVIRNTCSSATPPAWNIAAFNHVAPIVQAGSNATPIGGNSYSGSLGSTDPNANFSF